MAGFYHDPLFVLAKGYGGEVDVARMLSTAKLSHLFCQQAATALQEILRVCLGRGETVDDVLNDVKLAPRETEDLS